MLRRRTQHALLLVLGLLVSATAVPLLAAGPAPTEPAPARDVLFDETFGVRSGGTLRLDLGSEDVDVRTVAGERARVVVEGSGRDAASEFRRRRFSARAERGDLVVRTDPPRGSRRPQRADARFQVTVEVPRRYSADLDLGSGDVDVASLVGDLRVDVGSGELRLHDVDGRRVALDTGSGGVRAGTLRGDVRIDTGSGGIRIDRVEGSLTADTGSGGVTVGAVDGPVTVSAGSGGIDVGLRSSAATTLSAGSGTVTVRVRRGLGFDVDLDGGSVRLDDALGFRGRRDRDAARGEIGGGGPALRVETGSGQIHLLRE